MTQRECWIQCHDVRLYAVEEGEGVLVVMLHGGMATHLTALSLVRPLADHHRIVVPDLRGSGRSWYGGSLNFDKLSDDVERLLDHFGTDRAVVGGVSTGSGVALRFALRHPDRLRGLVLVKPMHAGASLGYTEEQRRRFALMDSAASRVFEEGVQALRPLYAALPEGPRERAMAMIESFDPASVVTTSRFLSSELQPFGTASELAALHVPTLVIVGDDPMHPPEVSDLYASNVRDCTVVTASPTDVSQAIRSFVDRCTA